MINPYQEGFDNWAEIQAQYQMTTHEPEYVLFAIYTYEGYEGSSVVIYWDDGKYYMNSGSHCSCYGLEGQWSPEVYYTADLLVKCVVDRGYGEVAKNVDFIKDAIVRNESRIKK